MSLVLQDQLVLSPATADHLQEEIDAIEAASDVADVVGTYEELEDYDTSALTDKDVIKVLDDETHDHAQTYWRYSKSGDSFTYIGQIAKPAVDSVNGKTGDVVLNKSDVGLGNVDNTSDANKPISTATQTALNAKQDTLVNQTNIKSINGDSILGSGNLEISAHLVFPSSWPTTNQTTTKQFCDVVAADSTATAGKMYLGEVRWSDLSSVGLVNAEVVVEVMDGTTAANKVIVLTMTSGNHAPYLWKYTYWNGGSSISGWKSFVPTTGTANQVYGTDGSGNQTTYNKNDFGQVDDVQVNGVSIVTNKIANVPTEVEWATYNVTTYQQVKDWYDANKIVCLNHNGYVYTIQHMVYNDSNRYFVFARTTSELPNPKIYHIKLYGLSGGSAPSGTGWQQVSSDTLQKALSGTSGNVVTYSNVAGMMGSVALATVATTGDYADLINVPEIQLTTMPEATSSMVDKVVQYIGQTDANYTNGYFYKCTETLSFVGPAEDATEGEPGESMVFALDSDAFAAYLQTKSIVLAGQTTFYLYEETDAETGESIYVLQDADYVTIEEFSSLVDMESTTGITWGGQEDFTGDFPYSAENATGFVVGPTYAWTQVEVQPAGDNFQYDVMPAAKAENEGQIIQYTGKPNECTVGSYVNQYGVAPALMPTFVYNAETFATFLSDRGANPNTGTDILFTSVPNDEYGGMDLKITYNNGQDEYVVNLEEEFPNWSSYPPSKAEEYDEMYGALGFETNYTELCSDVEIMNTLEWMGNPDGDGCISLTLPNPSNYVNGYFYKNTPTSVKVTNGSLSVLYFDGGDDEGDLPAPEPITFNVDTFNAYAVSVSQPEVDHIDFYVDFETSPETGDIENILIHYNNFNDTISISVSEDSIPAFQSALASVGVGIDLTGFTRFNSLDATLPIENVYSWQQVDVQPAGSSLPDQTGQTGKFLTTDGTDASWGAISALQNTATGTDALTILGTPTDKTNSVNIGVGSGTSGNGASVAVGKGASSSTSGVAVGYASSANNMDATAVGYIASASWSGTAIGSMARANGNRSIQLGRDGTNNDANTMKVSVQSGNYEMMSADGTIPEARLADMTNASQGQVLTLDSNNNAVWATPSSGGSVPTLTWYTISTAGTTLTIADTSSAQLVKIYKNGLLLQPTEDYTISGTTLTTVSAMVVGDKITTEVF